MNKTATEILELIKNEVCMGTYGLVELELRKLEEKANKQNVKLPKEAIENIAECISSQKDIPIEFKAVLVNDFWELL